MRAHIGILLVILAAACGGSGGAETRPAVALAFSVQPGPGSAVAPLAPAVQVELRDADGLLVTGATPPVTLALAAPAGGATLGGTVTRAAVAGVATFDGLTVERAGAGYRLAATSPGLTGATSAPFDVAAGPPARLLVSGQPVDGRTSTPLSPALEVRVEDAAGNPLDGVEVQVQLASGPGGAALRGTTTATSSAGLAVFPDLAAAGVGGYRLEASVAGLPAVTTDTFTLTDAWRTVGLDGGLVAVAADPAEPLTALAGGQPHVGLWRTTDGGVSWSPVEALRDRTVTPHFEAPGVAWAVGDTVWRSSDGGVTWVESPGLVRLQGGAALRPAFDPVSGAAYLVVNDYENRLLVSADAGVTWEAVAPPLPAGAYPYAVAAGPGGLAALTSQGFQALARGAAGWTSPVAVDSNPYRLLLHPTDPLVAFVAGVGGIHRTADGGATWSQSSGFLFRDLWIDPADSTTVLGAAVSAGVFRSTDGGLTFDPVNGPDALDVRSLDGAAGRLYLGADTGPLASVDGGATWARAAGGLRVGRITAVAVSPGDSSIILAGNEAGEVHRSADGGATWARVLYLPGQWARAFLFDTATPERVYLANGGYLMLSTDGGATWGSLPASPPGLIGLAGCAMLPAHLWVTDQNGSGVWRSTDGGDSWIRVYTTVGSQLNVGEVAADAADPLVAWVKLVDFVPPYGRTGLYRTTDGGASWVKRPVSAYGGKFATGPAGVVWSTSSLTVAWSADGGETFASVPPPMSVYATALAADPRVAGRAVVGGQGSWTYDPGDGVWITADGGATWSGSRSGHDRFATGALAIDPGAPEVIYAGTLGGGLLVSTTGGF